MTETIFDRARASVIVDSELIGKTIDEARKILSDRNAKKSNRIVIPIAVGDKHIADVIFTHPDIFDRFSNLSFQFGKVPDLRPGETARTIPLLGITEEEIPPLVLLGVDIEKTLTDVKIIIKRVEPEDE